MKVLHVIPRDVGGGGRAALRLHRGLRAIGVDSLLFAKGTETGEKDGVYFSPQKPWSRKARKLWLRWREKPYRESLGADPQWSEDDVCEFGGEALGQMPKADVINVHGLHGFIDLSSFCRRFARDQRVVFTLHTMTPFTGGCLYSGACRGFESRCGGCPQLGSTFEDDLSRDVFLRKQRAYGRLRTADVRLVAPSAWMAGEAKDSSMFKRFTSSVIPYGLDTQVYAPQDRRAARAELGVAPDATLVLFLTQFAIGNRRKGFAQLMASLAEAKATVPNLQVLALGGGELPADLPVPGLHLGFVAGEARQALAYAAADVVAVPSLHDNLPLVIQEAFACGTPVAAFRVGGIPDLVRPGITGELAPVGDAAGLARAIERVVKNGDLGGECRRVAVAEYGLELQAQRYLALYEQMLR